MGSFPVSELQTLAVNIHIRTNETLKARNARAIEDHTMPSIAKKIQFLTLATASLLSATISILGMFGLLTQESWIAQRIPLITLLLLSGLLAYSASGLAGRFEDIESCLRSLQDHADRRAMDQVATLRSQLDPNLELVFGGYFSNLLEKVEKTLAEQTIELHDLDTFLHYYKLALEKYPKATFFATSLPYTRYMWKSKGLEEAIQKFVESGGRMVRIFFLDSLKELEDAEIRKILDKHCNIGSEVYIADSTKTPHDLSSYFVVEKEGRISWEVIVNPKRVIVKVTASSRQRAASDYLRKFQKIRGLDSTSRYTVAHSQLKKT